MNKSKTLIVLIVIASIIMFYEIYMLFSNGKKPSNGRITPTPTVTIEPTVTPVITPEPTVEPPQDLKEEIYNDIYLSYKDDKKTINLSTDDDNSVIFTIDGNNSQSSDIYYEIVLNSEYKSDAVINLLTLNLLEIDDNDNVLNRIDISKFNTLENRTIYVGNIGSSSKINKRYKLEITHDGTSTYNEITVNVKVSLEQPKSSNKASEIVLKSIQAHPSTTWTDTSDNVIYFSGTNSVVNYNYVYYSGKIWRITAINPDGTLRLITENLLTTINWGKNIEYNGSWAYQWINEDFYDTLYNPKNIIVPNVTWNYTTDGGDHPKKPETLPNQRTVAAPIGLLSSYEYLNAYRNSQYKDNYLNISHYWWHITPQKTQAVRSTNPDGKQDLYDRNPAHHGRGIRPVIYLNSNVEFTGTGTKSDPYRIIGDIPNAKSNDPINSRVSGEYVYFNNAVYRIVNIEDNKTKIQMVDYLKSGGKKIEKHLARTIYFGRATNTQNEQWWDYYLKNVWYPTIPATYQNMVTDGTYYMGTYYLDTHYKNTICQDANLDVVTVKNCTKYSDPDHIYVGKFGLIRVGEMFSAQQDDIERASPTFWTISPYDDIENRIILETNSMWRHATWGGYHVVHPTFYLKEDVKITSGAGTYTSPYALAQ